ncbi:uracil-DNA glycosylase family protein [Rhizobiales bacterium]|uniref:uracil-DNA glycosylase family protein n=1 Tax=Hongsoonwoonella zoysiae TaxID=2821844 RepID=UPI0015611E0E|nr:uracil-DNA glycosylase family protein [Hongsoonwoonella zoysiae]NRG16306.1 uracil-DNA glycosylase family protein [Hongsoonwoonella zoysiae]
MPADPSKCSGLDNLLASVRACTICEGLPLGAKPILQAGTEARILIAGQAPGRKAHERGIPFDDASGDRLRDWLGVDRDTFYDASKIAVLPMGFCFPGTSKNGDLPPRGECAPAWREKLLENLEKVELTIVIGQYAQDWHFGSRRSKSLTETVANWRAFWPDILPLPHPSPRNQRWFKQNPFFEEEILPELRARVRELIG